MKSFRRFSLFLCLVIALSVVCGCSDPDSDPDLSSDDGEGTENSPDDATDSENSDATEDSKPVEGTEDSTDAEESDPEETDPKIEKDVPLDTDRSGDTDFQSADPSHRNYGENDADTDTDTDTDTDADGDIDNDAEADTDGESASEETDPEREIIEADIVHVVGDTLYALSRYRGLVVIDISDPSDLQILGRFQAYGVPFEMYVRDNIVMALYSSFYAYEYDEENGTWESRANSRVLALDVTNPADILERGAFELLGAMSDSRIVGDVLYTVSFQNGWCWGCDSTRKTAITSLDISNLSSIRVADSLEFEEENYSWRRSIAVNQDRMYVSGPGYAADNGEYQSTLQVVDISDPSGDLVAGAEVPLAGQIESRWQMNEYDGVLRIISQPGSTWGSGAQPVVETFEVVSSQQVTPLGRMEMALPRPENLMSVRFDKDRAYAVTFERTDPLFVIDLSEPTNPVQLGELEIPGWLYHMEPRGDRLFAIGFDDSSDAGGMAVSLFDVANPTEPVLLDRVNFGGDWVGMPEDQDRIHKAFKILDDYELILMPFSGWSRNEEGYYMTFHSGIQLIDFSNDNLTLRGVAPHKGQARRAFIHNEKLFAMSDERVDAFDIFDRDNPVMLSSVTLSRTVYRTVRTGDYLAELVSDWWTSEARIDILPVDDPDGSEPLATLDLSPLRPEDAYEYYYWRSGFNYYNTALYSHENYVYLLWREYTSYLTDDGYTSGKYKLGVAIFDLSDPTQPQLVGHELLPFFYIPGRWYSYYSGSSMPRVGADLVQHGSIFVLEDRYREGLHVLDLTDPADVSVVSLDSRTDINMTGLSNGKGGIIYSSHSEPVAGDESLVRFYLDRLDISDPSDPAWLSSVNIPGTPVYYSSETGKLVTMDYVWAATNEPTRNDCIRNRNYYSVSYDEDSGECTFIEYRLAMLEVTEDRAVLTHERLIGDIYRPNMMTATEDAIFLNISHYRYWDFDVEANYTEMPRLWAWSLSEETPFKWIGDWTIRSLYAYLQDAVGTRALVSSSSPPTAFVYDAASSTDGAVREELLNGYGYEMQLDDDMIISANGVWGVQAIPL